MRSLTAAGLMAALQLAATAHAAPPAEAFARLPAIDSPHLSPDGRRVSFVIDYNGRPTAAVLDIATDRTAAFPSDNWLVLDANWGSNDRLILTVGKTTHFVGGGRNIFPIGRAIAIDPDGENGVGLLGDNIATGWNSYTAIISDLTIDDPSSIFMPLFVPGNNYTFRYDLYEVDLATGSGTAFMRGTDETRQWIMDGAGKVVGRVDFSERPLRETFQRLDGDEWVTVWTAEATASEGLDILGLNLDGTALAHLKRNETGHTVMGFYDLAKRESRKQFSRPPYDIAAAWYEDWTRRVIGAIWIDDRMQTAFFDPIIQGLQEAVQETYPGYTVVVRSLSRDHSKAVVQLESPREPAVYLLVDVNSGAAQMLGRAYPSLPAEALGEMKPWYYKARDGLTIPAYLTLPPGKAAQNLPLIVMPHGGPDARDFLRFDWMAQFLASRGYAVLQPNFRGSLGYGAGFTQAGLRQWGLKMQDDVSDGVLKAIADGIADPKRVCIVGASYGGYSALAGATLTPDLYACAAAIAGVSDLPKMIARERREGGSDSMGYLFWISRIGSPTDDSAQLRATSPARHADAVRCPILLMHGERDTTVPIEQSQYMRDALKKSGKPYQYVTFEGDDHYLQLAATRLTLLTELEKFLAANIGN